jgi:hypothetical protein
VVVVAVHASNMLSSSNPISSVHFKDGAHCSEVQLFLHSVHAAAALACCFPQLPLGLQITVTKRPINALDKTALILVITL